MQAVTLPSAITGFLNHCQLEKGLSEKTMKAYRIDLEQFESLFKSKQLCMDVVQISKTELREYLASLSNLKPKSIKRKLAVAKALFNYLEFEDWIPVNPFRKMRIRIREEKVLPSVMNLREISRILRNAYSRKMQFGDQDSWQLRAAIRDIVVLELLFTTGARVSEIAGLKTNHINLDSGSIILHGKGNKQRMIHICNKETLSVLKLYQSLFKDIILSNSKYFLINRLNKKLSDQSIRGIVKKYVQQAGLKRRITPHAFRHSFATLLLEKDVDIKYIQSLLGHSSITTTQIYTHVNRAKQKRILRSKHPREGMRMEE